MAKHKVLYISYDGLTDPLGQSQILPYLTGLSKHGYEFTILSFEKRDRYEREKQTVETICSHARIEWVPLFFTSKPPVLSKIYDRWRMKKAVIKLYRSHSFSMVHCRSYIAAEMGLTLKEKSGTKFLFDMRGFWADEKVDGGQWDQSKWLFRRIYSHYKKMEQRFLLKADAIISLTHAAKKEILRQDNYQHLNIDVIPCCADLHHFDYNKTDYAKTEKLRNELEIPSGSKVLSYLGSVGGWYMTNEMFDFFRELKSAFPEYIMLILTKDKPEGIFQQAFARGIDPGSLRIAYAPRNVLPDYLSLSNASIFFIRNTYSKMASSPTKHAELMGMGIPVICNDLGDTGHIMNESKTGLVVESFNISAYDRVVNDMNNLIKLERAHIRQAAFNYFDLDAGIKHYSEIYKRLLPA